MIDEKTLYNLYALNFEKELISEIAASGKRCSFKAVDILIDFRQSITQMPLLLTGIIKIMREDEEGNELLLYFLEKGDTCAMSLNYRSDTKRSEIRAVAETDGELVMLPVQKMDEWLIKYSSWRTFVLNSYQNRLEEMLSAIDNLAFSDMNSRLKHYLTEITLLTKSDTVNKTHLEIAGELNTSRVVISRLLKALEKEGFLQLNRNQITLRSSPIDPGKIL